MSAGGEEEAVMTVAHCRDRLPWSCCRPCWPWLALHSKRSHQPHQYHPPQSWSPTRAASRLAGVWSWRTAGPCTYQRWLAGLGLGWLLVVPCRFVTGRMDGCTYTMCMYVGCVCSRGTRDSGLRNKHLTDKDPSQRRRPCPPCTDGIVVKCTTSN